MADDVKPWPAWVRYPLIAVFAAVGGIGLVLAVTSGIQAGAVRIVIAAVLIPAVLAPIRLWGSRRSAPSEPSPSEPSEPSPSAPSEKRTPPAARRQR